MTRGDARELGFVGAARRAGLAEPSIVDYRHACATPSVLDDARGPLRFDSPGRDPEVLVELLGRGEAAARAEGSPALDREQAIAALADRGRIAAPRQLHLGLIGLLHELQARAVEATPSNDAGDIELACHKSRCQAALAAAGVPIPAHLGRVSSYDELRARMHDAGVSRVFVKLDHGASASGLIAYEVSSRGEHAWTTAELVSDRSRTALYNTRRVGRHRDAATIRALVDELARHGAYAERWFPKAAVEGRSCDVRALLVRGEITHLVLRCSSTPFTNLHLGGTRVDPAALRDRVLTRAWESMQNSVCRVARAFPRSLALGIDVALGADRSSHAVLEVNAFGDLLHGVIDARGRDAYDAQLAAACA